MTGPAFPKPGPKRAPLKSGQHRRKNIPAKREEQRRSGRERDEWWLQAVRSLGYCAAARAGAATPCRWRWRNGAATPEADHMGDRGGAMGRKCSDRETAPLCSGHHEERTRWQSGTGWCRAWSKPEMRAFCAAAIAEAAALVTAARALCCCGDSQHGTPSRSRAWPGLCHGRLYLCPGQPGRAPHHAPWCFGAGDETPDLCDDCATAPARRARALRKKGRDWDAPAMDVDPPTPGLPVLARRWEVGEMLPFAEFEKKLEQDPELRAEVGRRMRRLLGTPQAFGAPKFRTVSEPADIAIDHVALVSGHQNLSEAIHVRMAPKLCTTVVDLPPSDYTWTPPILPAGAMPTPVLIFGQVNANHDVYLKPDDPALAALLAGTGVKTSCKPSGEPPPGDLRVLCPGMVEAVGGPPSEDPLEGEGASAPPGDPAALESGGAASRVPAGGGEGPGTNAMGKWWCPPGHDDREFWLGEQARMFLTNVRRLAAAGKSIAQIGEEYPGADHALIAHIIAGGDDEGSKR